MNQETLPMDVTPTPIHYLTVEVHQPSGEVYLAFKCTAEHGADCWKRHPEAESWHEGDAGLVDGDSCWAVEWVDAMGLDEALKPAAGVAGILASIPIRVAYDEGVEFTPITPAPEWRVEFTEPLNGDREAYTFPTEAEATEFATSDTTSGNSAHRVVPPGAPHWQEGKR